MTQTAEQIQPEAPGTSDVLVSVEDLKVHFPIKRGIILDRVVGHVYAVDGVDLVVRRGETYGLVGESGCGKTTLGRALLRLVEPTGGRTVFDGVDLSTLDGEELRRMRRRMQMVFQDPLSSLDPRQSVESILVEGMRAHGLAKDRQQTGKRLRELLDAVGLPSYSLYKYPHEFSGGQRQRIGIARALTVQPDLIVADEPVSALDVSVQAQVINLLEDLQGEFGLTYIVIAHDLAVVRHISDRIGVMYLGSVVEEADSDELYQTRCIRTRVRCCRPSRCRTRSWRIPANRSCWPGTCRRRPSRPLGAASTPAARGGRSRSAPPNGPSCGRSAPVTGWHATGPRTSKRARSPGTR